MRNNPRFETRQLLAVANRAYRDVVRVLGIISILPIDDFIEFEAVELVALPAFQQVAPRWLSLVY
jgi:hypothetical protein